MKMGSVYQIKSGKYKGQWRGNANLPKVWKEDKQKWHYPKKVVYAKNEPEAKRLVNEIENQVYKNTFANSRRITVADYLNRWIDIYCTELEETTQALYRMYIRVHINPELGHLLLKDVLPATLQQFYNKKRKGGYEYKDDKGNVKIRPALKGKTVGKLHTLLNNAFKDAVNNKLLYDNPCSKIDPPKKEKYVPMVYNEQEMQKLLTLVEGTFDEVCIVMAAFTALRRGEVFGLRPVDVNFENHTFTVIETKTKFDKWLIKKPKSETSQRTIKIPEFVLNIIKRYLNSLKVVPERICGAYTPDSYSKHFKALLLKNDLPRIRYHDLRHFAGSILSKYNVPKPTIKDFMGHADEQTTSIYTHSLSDMADMTTGVMEKVYFRK
jgi:integrase